MSGLWARPMRRHVPGSDVMSTRPNKKKNYRLGKTTLAHLQECLDDLGLTTETMGVRVAIEHLYATRENLNVTEYLVRLRMYDQRDQDTEA